ncbi:DUF4129 domain-containing protein [Saccharicrinis sp. FJH54]|uniref:DUF4129 domain-containing protein n=1 Tax=Saccharicrinis sp. FJH54 TaxID=3344665 RepID=UPI0035D4B2FB
MSKPLLVILVSFLVLLSLSAKDLPYTTVDSTRIDSVLIQKRVIDTAALNSYKQDSDFDYGQGYQQKTVSLWSKFWEWIFQKLRQADGVYRGLTVAVKIFFWLLVVAILVFAITKIRFQRFFYSQDEKEGKDYIVDDADELIEDLDAAIDNAVEQHNYRLAIRYQFLNVLRKLDELGVINYSKDKTNRDYLSEIRRKTDSVTEFLTLINIYNAVWYGHFTIDEEDYRRLSMSYTNFNKMAHA